VILSSVPTPGLACTLLDVDEGAPTHAGSLGQPVQRRAPGLPLLLDPGADRQREGGGALVHGSADGALRSAVGLPDGWALVAHAAISAGTAHCRRVGQDSSVLGERQSVPSPAPGARIDTNDGRRETRTGRARSVPT
jgi:hypothetical protein